ncbi:MAG: hypothetical protein ACI9K2_003796, partial [Myxococcota bacterium]
AVGGSEVGVDAGRGAQESEGQGRHCSSRERFGVI